MAVLSTLLRITNFHNPFLRTLIPSIGAAFALQAAVAVPSILAQSERFYDLSGSLTYLSVAALSLYLPAMRARGAAHVAGKALPEWPSLVQAVMGRGGNGVGAGAAAGLGFNWRQVVLTAAVGIWATRLGSYLFQRIMSDGSDSRFDKIKKSPPKFLIAFIAQATWVSLCLMPILAVNSIPTALLASLPAVTATDVLGLSMFASGLAFEVVADRQKSAWVAAKKNKQHDEDFLTSGLWAKSRHPNYFGESTLWSGIAVTAAGVLAGKVGRVGMGLGGSPLIAGAVGLGLCAVSPAFVTFLLLKVSGVPLSETKYDRKYGEREDYKKWKRETPMFIPKL